MHQRETIDSAHQPEAAPEMWKWGACPVDLPLQKKLLTLLTVFTRLPHHPPPARKIANFSSSLNRMEPGSS